MYAAKLKRCIVNLVLVGSEGVGKTQIFNVACSDNQQTLFTPLYAPTIGLDFKTKTISEGQETIVYTTWDTTGQEGFKSMIAACYRGKKVVVLCFDLSGSLEDVKKDAITIRAEIQQYANKNVPVCIIGTKADLADQLGTEHNFAANKEYLQTLASEFPDLNIQGVFVTSAKEKDNANYNQRIDSVAVDPNTPPINSLDTVMDSVRSVGLAHVKSLGIERRAAVQPTVAEPRRRLLSELNDKFVPAGELREIMTGYSSTSIFGKNNRHSAMKNLDNLLLGKENNDKLKGSDIVNCLGSRGQFFSKQRKIEEHLTNNTMPTASTEGVYVKIYNQMMMFGDSR